MVMKATEFERPVKQGAGCLLFVPETKKFLVIQRSEAVPAPLTWCLPGGSVNQDEDPIDAARREVAEETGIDITDKPLIQLYTVDYHAPRFRFHTYGCLLDMEIKPNLNWESAAYGWFTVDNLPENLHVGLAQLMRNDVAAKTLKDFVDKHK